MTLRATFLNENVGGHATMHLAIREALAEDATVDATFVDVPAPGLPRKLVAAPVPGLGALDLDLHPLRSQLAAASVARRAVGGSLDDADVVHVYSQNAGLLLSDVLAGMPSVVSTDATNQQNAFRLPQRRPTWATDLALVPTRAFERRVFEAATLVGAKSEWVAASMQATYGVERSRIRIIPFGITIRAQDHRGSDGLPRITFVGRSMARKGGSLLLDVWRDHLRESAVLTLVTLEDVPPEPGLEVRRDVRPGDGKIETILAETDVFAFPTELDTFGYAAIEAMAAGVPVVATRTGGVPEVVADGVTGLLVDPGDGDQLREALQRLLRNPGERLAMGEAGRVRAETRFDARVTTAQLVEVLREAVDLGPRRGAPRQVRGGTAPIAVVISSERRPTATGDIRPRVTTQRGATSRLVLVDDASGESLAAIRNREMASAEEAFVLFLDQGDVLAPHALRTMVHAATVTGAPVVAGQRIVVDDRGLAHRSSAVSHPERSRLGPMWRELDASDDLVAGAFLFRRDAVIDVGGFDESVGEEQFRELLWRLAGRGHAWVVIPEVVVASRCQVAPATTADIGVGTDRARRTAMALGPEVARRLGAWDVVRAARSSDSGTRTGSRAMFRAVVADPGLLSSPAFRHELIARVALVVPALGALSRSVSGSHGPEAAPGWVPVSGERGA